MIDVHVLRRTIAILSTPAASSPCINGESLPRINVRRSCLGTGARSQCIGSTKRNDRPKSGSAKMHSYSNSAPERMLPGGGRTEPYTPRMLRHERIGSDLRIRGSSCPGSEGRVPLTTPDRRRTPVSTLPQTHGPPRTRQRDHAGNTYMNAFVPEGAELHIQPIQL